MIEARCVRKCYDSTSCKFYEEGITYQVDEKAFAVKGGNGLLKHFLPFSEMDRDQARKAEKDFEAQRERDSRAASNTRMAAMRTEPSEKPRAKARA